jgi:hypothetical protein
VCSDTESINDADYDFYGSNDPTCPVGFTRIETEEDCERFAAEHGHNTYYPGDGGGYDIPTNPHGCVIDQYRPGHNQAVWFNRHTGVEDPDLSPVCTGPCINYVLAQDCPDGYESVLTEYECKRVSGALMAQGVKNMHDGDFHYSHSIEEGGGCYTSEWQIFFGRLVLQDDVQYADPPKWHDYSSYGFVGTPPRYWDLGSGDHHSLRVCRSTY